VKPGFPGIAYFVPSVSDLFFLAFFFALCMGVLQPRLLGDAGIGWHIRNGQLMLQTHAITRTDPFSAGGAGQPWFAWEWLYDLAVGALDSAWGLNGVVLFGALVIALTFFLVLRRALRDAGLLLAVLFVLLALCAATIHFFARPHVFSWLFGLLWWTVLDAGESAPNGDRRLWLLPLLMILWVNVHGGFLVGLMLTTVYLAGAAIESRKDGRARPHVRRLALVFAGSALATLVNPYFYHLHAHIYGYLSDRFLMSHVDEFRSPNFHLAAQQCFAALTLLSLSGFALVRKLPRPSRLLVMLFAVISGMFASRNLPFSSILLVLVAAPVWSDILTQARQNRSLNPRLARLLPVWQSFSARMTRIDLSLRGHLWPAVGVIFAIWICAHSGQLGSKTVIHARFNPDRFPVAACDYLAAHNVREPVWLIDSWGGYVIYRFYPARMVVLDDRHDFYGSAFLRDYLTILNVQPGWDAKLAQVQARWLLIPSNTALASVLKLSNNWKVEQEDNVAILFSKTP
jgi:hypothetical protein